MSTQAIRAKAHHPGRGNANDSRTRTLNTIVTRAIAAVERAAPQLRAAECHRLKTAPPSSLLSLLAEKTAQRERDPIAQARARGQALWNELAERSGGFLTSAEVASLLRMTTAAVHKRYKAHQLLAIRGERRGLAYPALQFVDGRVVRDLAAVLRVLAHKQVSDHSQLRFLAGAHSRLSNRTAIRALRDGDAEQVIAAAEAYGEHGAD